jgi:putative membrane protein
MAREIHSTERSFPEGFESEMRSYGLTKEPELRGLHHEPFHEKGVYPPQINGRDIAKGAIAGAIGGLIASWAMVKFQDAWAKVAEAAHQRTAESKNLREHGVPEHRAVNPEGDQQKQPDDATVKTAEIISERLFRRQLSRDEKKIAGPAVHYAFGIAVGALYGAAAEAVPAATAGFGTAFGAAVFVAADEIAVPALGLSPNVKTPLSKHVYGFASHLVFGVATEAARKPVRAMMK